MPVNSTHPDYDFALPGWLRARDVLAGEDAVKSAGEKYLPRLDSQTDEEFLAYRKRASFFNATARSAEGFVGLIFRRAPFIRIPEVRAAPAIASERRSGDTAPYLSNLGHGGTRPYLPPSGVEKALAEFVNDADMQGTTLPGYAKNVVSEVVGIGRAGSLVDWQDEERRAYVSMYSAEQILNWRVERVNGRNVPTLIVLHECVTETENIEHPASNIEHRGPARNRRAGDSTPHLADDYFESKATEQIRVLKLVPGQEDDGRRGSHPYQYEVEIWRDLAVGHQASPNRKSSKPKWTLVETKVPLRLGKPLPLIPFVFHGPRHSRPDVG
jgi:hypothetical protein